MSAIAVRKLVRMLGPQMMTGERLTRVEFMGRKI
jgi:hypothetical protein